MDGPEIIMLIVIVVPCTATMDGPEIIMLSKQDRERQLSYAITYMWHLKKMIPMNLFTKQKKTHTHRKQTYGYQWREVGEE